MGSIITAPPPTPSRYLELHSIIGWVNGQGLRDHSGKRNHLVSTSGGQAVIDDDNFGTANWKTASCMVCPLKSLDTNLLDLSKAGRSFVVHYAMTLVGGFAGFNIFLAKTNDSGASVSGLWFGINTNAGLSKPRVQWNESGGANAAGSAFTYTADQEVNLTWVRDGVANTITLWVNKAKDATLQGIAFPMQPDQLGFFTVGGPTPTDPSAGFHDGGGTATGKRVRNLQVYLSDAPLPVGITNGSLIAWLIDNRNQHLSDTQWGV